ncbi:DUF1440 domain-containing protein [Liquorilactobacillus capillatus]|uniref:Periplasmic secreted protein n=1 Tax=Liquorilactobacillus capillatus DSM 19910 TaxID=1423731 RepID=A0A0R1M2Q2_9LACO|nr:DUF1440 domain-containing protein [Liquorilactobacillus capillatus]KRL01993.1 hypothetical protein FC81_GL000983 [Liquorilactobacillus capillatus DSM 19910]
MSKDSFNIKEVLIIGGVAGIVSGFVKLGWENLLPPRTPEREKTNPPQKFMQQLGIPRKITHATYTYSGHQMPWASFIIHFGFSATFGMMYSVTTHYIPLLKVGQGTFFGVGVWAAAHLGMMPAMKTVPDAKDQPLEEHFSELLGHMAWMWVNHVVINELSHELVEKKTR